MGNASSLTCENKSSFTITVVVFGVGIEEDEYDIKPGEEGQFIKYDKISFRISSGTSVIVNDADAGKYVIQDSLLNQNRLQCDHFEYDIDGEILSKVQSQHLVKYPGFKSRCGPTFVSVFLLPMGVISIFGSR